MTATTADRWLGSLLGKADSREPITGLEPTRTEDLKWNKIPRIDPLIAQLASAQRDLERAERTAMEARQAAEAYREQVEAIKAQIEDVLVYIGILQDDPQPPATEPKGEP